MRRLYNLFTFPKISNQPASAKYSTHIIFAGTSLDTDSESADRHSADLHSLVLSSPDEPETTTTTYHSYLQTLIGGLDRNASDRPKKFSSKTKRAGTESKRYFSNLDRLESARHCRHLLLLLLLCLFFECAYLTEDI